MSNQSFRNLIDAEFKGLNAIETYDTKHKMYEVNYLYQQSLK